MLPLDLVPALLICGCDKIELWKSSNSFLHVMQGLFEAMCFLRILAIDAERSRRPENDFVYSMYSAFFCKFLASCLCA